MNSINEKRVSSNNVINQVNEKMDQIKEIQIPKHFNPEILAKRICKKNKLSEEAPKILEEIFYQKMKLNVDNEDINKYYGKFIIQKSRLNQNEIKVVTCPDIIKKENITPSPIIINKNMENFLIEENCFSINNKTQIQSKFKKECFRNYNCDSKDREHLEFPPNNFSTKLKNRRNSNFLINNVSTNLSKFDSTKKEEIKKNYIDLKDCIKQNEFNKQINTARYIKEKINIKKGLEVKKLRSKFNKELNDLSECTFHPKLNKKSSEILAKADENKGKERHKLDYTCSNSKLKNSAIEIENQNIVESSFNDLINIHRYKKASKLNKEKKINVENSSKKDHIFDIPYNHCTENQKEHKIVKNNKYSSLAKIQNVLHIQKLNRIKDLNQI